MAVYRSFLLFAFAYCVLSEKVEFEKLFEPCNNNDLECWRGNTQNILENTHHGLPDYNIKPVDPLTVPEVKVVVDEGMGLTFEYKNVKVTGLKNQEMTDVKIDTDKKSVVFKSKADLGFEGDLKILFTKQNKEFNGPFQASATSTLVTTQYGYSVTTKEGQEYLVVGPETNSCEIQGEPSVAIGDVLLTALNNDSDARDMKPGYEANQVALRRKALCKIVETAFVTVVHNIRTSAETLPKSAFFKEI